MKVTVGQLRRIIRETAGAEAAAGGDFGTAMKEVLSDLYMTNKKIEKAHELAPQGPAKAIVAGMHSDLFNKIAEFRKHLEELSKLSRSKLSRSKAS